MFIEINDSTTLREFREKLSECFPYLQIELYIKLHKEFDTSGENGCNSFDKSMGDIKQIAADILEIQPYYKVIDVEMEFQKQFGLPVLIRRNETDIQKQITGTDSLTLKELNEMGKSFSDEFIIPGDRRDLGQNQEE